MSVVGHPHCQQRLALHRAALTHVIRLSLILQQWASIFLDFWKRSQTVRAFDWDMEDLHVRLEHGFSAIQSLVSAFLEHQLKFTFL